MLGNDSTLLNRLSDSSVNHLISVLNSSTTITPKALYETNGSSTVNLDANSDTLKTKKGVHNGTPYFSNTQVTTRCDTSLNRI
ncbi:hypothetical protein FIV04_05275 [Vibrio sp. THAF190c]|nr:hypothetical protein FIV04_05275 [Vibrio sp. THAF190c]